MWLGEQITERGVGNGISLLILRASLSVCRAACSRYSSARRRSAGDHRRHRADRGADCADCFIVSSKPRGARLQLCEAPRRTPTVGGQQTTMPLKVNMGGVIPVIFASSMLAVPQTLLSAFPADPNNPAAFWSRVHSFFLQFHGGDPYYELIFVSLIIFFTFFYVSIVFNVEEVADNLRKHGGFMPGIRPGKATAEFLNTVLTRLTLSVQFICADRVLPQIMLNGFRVGRFPFIGQTLDAFSVRRPAFRGYRPAWVINFTLAAHRF
jgi:preprotein translocase subunit SecY